MRRGRCRPAPPGSAGHVGPGVKPMTPCARGWRDCQGAIDLAVADRWRRPHTQRRQILVRRERHGHATSTTFREFRRADGLRLRRIWLRRYEPRLRPRARGAPYRLGGRGGERCADSRAELELDLSLGGRGGGGSARQNLKTGNKSHKSQAYITGFGIAVSVSRWDRPALGGTRAHPGEELCSRCGYAALGHAYGPFPPPADAECRRLGGTVALFPRDRRKQRLAGARKAPASHSHRRSPVTLDHRRCNDVARGAPCRPCAHRAGSSPGGPRHRATPQTRTAQEG